MKQLIMETVMNAAADGRRGLPFRMNVRPVAAFAGPLEFKPLIGDLTLITNKKMWSGHLRQAMRDIPGEDYRFILRRAGVEAADA